MMIELIEALVSWRSLLLAIVVFGFAPGFTLRMLVKIYPRDDPRRAEIVAELYSLGRIERLFFVAEQLETVLFEGLPFRVRAWTWPEHLLRLVMLSALFYLPAGARTAFRIKRAMRKADKVIDRQRSSRFMQ